MATRARGKSVLKLNTISGTTDLGVAQVLDAVERFLTRLGLFD